MLKHRSVQTTKEYLESILRNPSLPSIEFLDGKDLSNITEKWCEIECYNLNKASGIGRHVDLDGPWAVIFGSKTTAGYINEVYIKVVSDSSQYLYALESLEQAVDLVKTIRENYTTALLSETKSPHKKTVLN